MTGQYIVTIAIVIFLLTAFLIFLRISSVSKELHQPTTKNKYRRYVPAIVCFIILLLVITLSYYFEHEEQVKQSQFKELSNPTSLKRKSDYQSTAADTNYNFNRNKVQNLKQTIDSNYNVAVSLKKYVSTKNNFNRINPMFKDSVDSAFQNIKKRKLAIDSVQHFIKNPEKHGYAFYGIYNGGKWSEQNFETIGGGTYPGIGDRVRCLTPTNIRQSEIKLIEGKGWVNQPWIGALNINQEVQVVNIIVVASNYIWIQF